MNHPDTCSPLPSTVSLRCGEADQYLEPSEALEFVDITDPSLADTEAGFTFFFRVDYVESELPYLELPAYTPGASYTVDAYLRDKDGGASPLSSIVVRVPLYTALRNEGSGAVLLRWDGADPVELAANATHDFIDPIGSGNRLLDDGTWTYRLGRRRPEKRSRTSAAAS